jgi:tetratricopeptide (TPR) repeat protein
MHDYDSRDVRRLFGLSVTALRSLVRAGHLRPVKAGRTLLYSFDDLIVLRAVKKMRDARIPARSIGLVLRRANSAQFALPFEADRVASNMSGRHRHPASPGSGDANLHFALALDLEETDTAAAVAAYRSCLALEAHHREARLNLGRLLHLAGRLPEAETVYRQAGNAYALLSFNLAVLLEDSDRTAEAMMHYREAIADDPMLADAHFNLARLYALAGDAQAALRHLMAYRRQNNQPESP